MPYPYPDLHPLERLHVHDGLMINAERWSQAHIYHRRRQNIHYQALYQPGIVYGLGVRLVEPSSQTSLQIRSRDEQQQERRWIEIQPGLAIDLEGNPIVVDAGMDRTNRIAVVPPVGRMQTVYVVIRFVEPDSLEVLPQQITVPERFRFDQITRPPNEREIELCRIELQNPVQLAYPSNVFAPENNQIDLRYRIAAAPRPRHSVQVGWLAPLSNAVADTTYENWQYLMQAIAALHPELSGEVLPEPINLLDTAQLKNCTLLYASTEALQNSEFTQQRSHLEHYLQSGGTLLLETTGDLRGLEAIARQPLQSWSELGVHHQLRTQPFLFTQPPTLTRSSPEIKVAGGIIWLKGSLSNGWGVRANLSREEIRSAQEFGINVLSYAQQRWHFHQLMNNSP